MNSKLCPLQTSEIITQSFCQRPPRSVWFSPWPNQTETLASQPSSLSPPRPLVRVCPNRNPYKSNISTKNSPQPHFCLSLSTGLQLSLAALDIFTAGSITFNTGQTCREAGRPVPPLTGMKFQPHTVRGSRVVTAAPELTGRQRENLPKNDDCLPVWPSR